MTDPAYEFWKGYMAGFFTPVIIGGFILILFWRFKLPPED